tara:strand:+ start:95823 stop:96455 length:633 start_codon:yes stop_codon:yes gene_type:complete
MSEDEQTGTKTRLSAAAIKVFEEQGFHAARISDIAEAAGVAKGTFYLYFTNKEAVFHHLIDDFFGRLMGETLGRFPASAVMNRGDLAAQLGDMWRLILTRCRQEPVLTSLILRESAALGRDARERVEAHFTDIATAIAHYFDDLSARNLVRAGIGAASAWAVLGLIERAIYYAISVEPEAHADTLAEEFLSLELAGLCSADVGTDPQVNG